MVPINHSDDSLDVENLDSTNVPECEGKDESPTHSVEDVSDSHGTKKYGSATSQLPHETVNKTVSRNSESETRRQDSSKHGFAERNRSVFYRSEKCRDRQWRDERYRHKTDDRNRRQKLPSHESVGEHSPNLRMSDEEINDETAVSEPLVDRVNRRSSGDDGTELLVESRDSAEGADAGSAKPVMPSGRKQNNSSHQRRRYTHGRYYFSSAYTDYGDDYDYVLQLKHYNGPRRNRQPKSVKRNADVVSSDVGNKFDEEADDSHSRRAGYSSAVSSESVSTVVSSNKQNMSQLGDQPHQKRNNGYRVYRNTRDRQTSAPRENDTLSARDVNRERRQNNSTDTCNNTEIKRKTEHRQPRKFWNRQAPDKASRPSVNKDEELQTATSALSHLSVVVSEGVDIPGECATVEVMNDSFTATEMKSVKQTSMQQTSTDSCSQRVGSRGGRRNNRVRRGNTRFTKEPASRDDQQCGQDRAGGSSSRVEKEPYQKNRGSRRGARRNVSRESHPSNSQHSQDNPTDFVDKPTDVPSTKCDQTEPSSHSDADSFRMHLQPTATTEHLPSS